MSFFEAIFSKPNWVAIILIFALYIKFLGQKSNKNLSSDNHTISFFPTHNTTNRACQESTQMAAHVPKFMPVCPNIYLHQMIFVAIFVMWYRLCVTYISIMYTSHLLYNCPMSLIFWCQNHIWEFFFWIFLLLKFSIRSYLRKNSDTKKTGSMIRFFLLKISTV